MRLILVAAVLALASSATPAWAFDHSHGLLAEVLQAHVRAGRVDYAGLQRQPHSLRRYRDQIAALTPADLAGFSRSQQLALWINIYNAGVLASIVDNYPLSRGSLTGLAFPSNSIWQIPRVFKRKSHGVAGVAYSLDAIEHEILRPNFREPRLHMALVCAARSCPPLRSEPYRAEILDAQLNDQARQFLGDRQRGLQIDRESRRIEVSAIFKWFGEDFAAGKDQTRGVLNFISQHVDAKTRLELASMRQPRIVYLDYDWTLNE